jgi:hypothetical protein
MARRSEPVKRAGEAGWSGELELACLWIGFGRTGVDRPVGGC